MKQEPGDLYDVVIYKLDGNEITSIVGERMRLDTGHYNANKRLATALERCNEAYSAMIVPAGVYKVGDTVAAH